MGSLSFLPKRWVWVSAFAVLTLTACPEQKTVAVYRVVPGPMPLPGVSRLALGEIEGPGGVEVGHMLAQALMQHKGYEVLDWSSPFGANSLRGWANPQGGWDGADATVLGTVLAHTVSPAYTWQTTRGADGRELTQYARTLQLTVKALFRVIDPQTGRLLGSTTTQASVDAPPEYVMGDVTDLDESALGGLFSADANDGLRQAAYAELARLMAEQLRYGYEPVMVTLWHDAREEASVRALDGAAHGDWTVALQLYADALLTAEFDSPGKLPQAHYNYGVALGYSGNFSESIVHLETSYSLAQDKQTLIALEQVRGFAEYNMATR